VVYHYFVWNKILPNIIHNSLWSSMGSYYLEYFVRNGKIHPFEVDETGFYILEFHWLILYLVGLGLESL